MPKSVLLLLVAIHVIFAFFLYCCIPHLNEYGEPLALLPRITLGLRDHLLPFRDISWFYGPALYYLPQGFIAIGSLCGATSDFCYFLAYACCASLGIWALFYIVDSLRIQAVVRIVVFSVLALTADDLSLGLQYTLLRFVLPFAAVLLVHRTIVNATAESKGRRLLRACATAVLAVFVVLSISSKVGIAYAVAQTAYFVHRALFSRAPGSMAAWRRWRRRPFSC